MDDANQTVIEMHPKQFLAFQCEAQFILVACGVQSGKTYLGATWAQNKIEKFPTGVGLICAPTVKILQHSTLAKFFELFPEYRQYYKEQKGQIELPTGGIIYIRSADDPYGIEGMTIDWCWSDETGLKKRAFWLVIKARVAIKRGQVMMTSTPYNLGWMYREVFMPWKEGTDPDIAVFSWKSVENPYFPEDYYNKEKARLTPEEFARRYEGEFTRMEGLIWDIPKAQIIGDSPMLSRIMQFPDRVIGGLDWGFNHPAAALSIFVKDATYYVVDEWRESGKTTPEILTEAKRLQKLYNVSIWFPDSANPEKIEEMKRPPFSMHVGATNKDVSVGLSYVASLIKEGRLIFHERCVMMLDEASQYHFEPTNEDGKKSEKPHDVGEDLCCALRYALMGFRPNEPKSKNVPPIMSKTAVVNSILDRTDAPQRHKVIVKRTAE